MSSDDWILLALLAAMSLGIRICGALAGDQLGKYPVIKKSLEAVPGAVLVALVVPDLIGRGAEGMVGAVSTVGTMLYARNSVISMCAGIVVTAVWRVLV